MAPIAAPYIVAAPLLLMVLVPLLKLFMDYVWTPLRIHQGLSAEGISGPPFRLIVGNFAEFAAIWKRARASPLPLTTHRIAPWVLPEYTTWSLQYGNVFSFWLGNYARVAIGDPDLCKELLYSKHGYFQKSKAVRPGVLDLLANGLVLLEGERWAQHRRMVNPAFYIEKLKAFTPTFANLARNMLDTWQSKLQTAKNQVEIDMHEEFTALTADIIAHTGFGSSYAEGKQVFQLQQEQQEIMRTLIRSFYIPGSRFLPTALNRRRWKLSKEIEICLGAIIRKRLDSPELNKTGKFGEDLLGMMLSAFKEQPQGGPSNLKMSLQDVIYECNTFFIAGHETTSALLTWTAMLLSIHIDWQERAREEVISLFGLSHPDAEALNQMKVVGMILYETLRLYPPVPSLLRQASRSIKLGNLIIPAGSSIMIPIVSLHVDPSLWGPDADEFNPQRFANGVLKACTNPNAFLPFSAGPRNCVGQNFSLIEAKTVLCLILQRFRLRLSPGYRHSPGSLITLQPEHGMQIMVEAC